LIDDLIPLPLSIPASAAVKEDEPTIDEGLTALPRFSLAPADILTPNRTPHQKSYGTGTSFSTSPIDTPSKLPLSRFQSLDKSPRPLVSLEKELPPPPPEDELSPKTLSPSQISPEKPSSQPDRHRALRGTKSIDAMSHARSIFRTPSFRPLTSSTNYSAKTFSHHRGTPSASVFPGAPSSLDKTQPTYTVSISAPRLGRRFSRLSGRSKEPGIPEDPLAPVKIIPQMSNSADVGLTYLPRYTNNFGGFCKSRYLSSLNRNFKLNISGAWRLQVNDSSKAFKIRERKSSSLTPLLKCSKCRFEGPLYPARDSVGRVILAKVPDSRIYTSYGVSYTWQFLFKSHIALNKKSHKIDDTAVDMADGHFACIFCCAKGSGTPVFRGPEALSWHLRSHASESNSLDQELSHRFKVVIGRDLQFGETFDVYIPPIGTGPDSQWRET
jgi:hypothetical protein